MSMSEEQRRQLEQQLWNIANTLRGKMDADEFRDYILGFIFYKYLSEKMNVYADEILEQDGITYQSIDEDSGEGKQYIEAIREEAVESLGYFLKPSELFSAIARRGNGNGTDSNGKAESKFILEDLARILNNIEQSTMGTDSEDDFDHLFEDLDLGSTKLGRTVEAKNELISKVLSHLDKIDFRLDEIEADVLGDAYEYLIAQFASGAGKKAGEFYTPQEVSKVLAKLVTVGKDRLKSVYDPTCGSGSLLLRVKREVKEVGKFYGQELNRTTYNLCRMNMILHGINYQKFDIKQEDSLDHPQHPDLRAEAIVANPPFSAKWSANPLHLGDDRFSQYGRLAPSSKADWAFIQHMIYHLGENGTMAVVAPHGVLFRGAAEGHIRKYLIEDRNYLDAVIGLPTNIFYGTSIPTCILVFKKCKEQFNDILFIDASRRFEKRGNQNYLRAEDIDRIVEVYKERTSQEKYSYVATLDEVKGNDYNLNIPRYVDTFEEEELIDLEGVTNELRELNAAMDENDKVITDFCRQLGISTPF
jgi:type I restriction enzyme M protein